MHGKFFIIVFLELSSAGNLLQSAIPVLKYFSIGRKEFGYTLSMVGAAKH